MRNLESHSVKIYWIMDVLILPGAFTNLAFSLGNFCFRESCNLCLLLVSECEIYVDWHPEWHGKLC